MKVNDKQTVGRYKVKGCVYVITSVVISLSELDDKWRLLKVRQFLSDSIESFFEVLLMTQVRKEQWSFTVQRCDIY
jgi:hypothetical protein